MSDSVDILKKLALQVRNASTEGENTAERIGRIFIGILENMDNSDLEKLTKYFLRKDKEDIANELITFLKGLLIGKNGSGITVLEDGTSQAVVDRLYVKIKAVFDELEVKKKTHVGGEQILSPAGMKCVRVEELDESYRCFFLSEVDGITINNEFTVGTLALAQEFNIKEGTSHNVSNRYYWREVTGVGSDYIDLSKTNADKDSDIPVAGDDIIGLGHLTDITRQAAIILSSVNETSPSIIFTKASILSPLPGKKSSGWALTSPPDTPISMCMVMPISVPRMRALTSVIHKKAVLISRVCSISSKVPLDGVIWKVFRMRYRRLPIWPKRLRMR